MSDTATLAAAPSQTQPKPGTVKVWDLFVRIFHWSLVSLFALAWATGDEWESVHEAAGYAIAALITARIIWGFAGTRHARFSSFIFRPSTVLSFLRDSVFMRARRYIGHNPAGGAMVMALLVLLGVISASGYAMTTTMFWGIEWVEDLHKAAVNITLVLIVLHVAGVILASVEHKENLVRAMFTGRKRAERAERAERDQ